MKALFGGTFNPIHNGHLALASEVAAAFDLDCIEFLPSYQPVHRDAPETSSELRKQLVELAIAHNPQFSLNSSELERGGPSYAFDTLSNIKAQEPGTTICWLMGADSFNSFLSWYQPEGILQLAHLIVCQRPQVGLDKSIFAEHQLQPGQDLGEFASGKIVFYPMQPNPCSATSIRAELHSGGLADDCLPPPVLEFIQQNHLYE